jgi:hypothetical protein
MPIPKEGKKAIYIADKNKDLGKYILKNGDKGVIIKHSYNSTCEYAFYPAQWNGYCITVFENEFKLINKKNANNL